MMAICNGGLAAGDVLVLAISGPLTQATESVELQIMMLNALGSRFFVAKHISTLTDGERHTGFLVYR